MSDSVLHNAMAVYGTLPKPGNAFNDLVAALDMHPQTVQRLIRSGQLPGRKIARKWFVPRGEFEAFMDGRWKPAQSAPMNAEAA